MPRRYRRKKPRVPQPTELMVERYPRPRCPLCGCPKLKKYRSLVRAKDTTSVWWVKCTDEMCGLRFKVILE